MHHFVLSGQPGVQRNTLPVRLAAKISPSGETVSQWPGHSIEPKILPVARSMCMIRPDSHSYAAPSLASRRSEEHTSELPSLRHLVCRHLLEKKKVTVRDEHVQDADRLYDPSLLWGR